MDVVELKKASRRVRKQDISLICLKVNNLVGHLTIGSAIDKTKVQNKSPEP